MLAQQSFIGAEARVFHNTSPQKISIHKDVCIYVVLSGNTTMFQSFSEHFTWKSALADFQHKQWSRVLRSVYSEVPEAPETTYDESLQTSGMNTLHTWALEHSERRFGILTRVIFQLMTALLSFCPPGAVNTDGDDHVPRHR